MVGERLTHLSPVRTPGQIATLLAELRASTEPACRGEGTVANYIPELGLVEPDRFGAYVATIDGREAGHADFDTPFSIQSIAKVLALAMAYDLIGEELWRRVDVEPSGGAFNSLVQLEYDAGIPRNPMINAGALVVADVLVTEIANPKAAVLDFVRRIAEDGSIGFDSSVAASELATGYRNEAVVQFMRDFGNVHAPLGQVMDFYCHLCALSMSCRQLAHAFGFLANRGVVPRSGERVLSAAKAKRINAIMLLCGFYDEAGEFAFRVGLPGKSGVGGGIAAIHPGKFSAAVYSPRLNARGNSVAGMAFLEAFTTVVDESIF